MPTPHSYLLTILPLLLELKNFNVSYRLCTGSLLRGERETSKHDLGNNDKDWEWIRTEIPRHNISKYYNTENEVK